MLIRPSARLGCEILPPSTGPNCRAGFRPTTPKARRNDGKAAQKLYIPTFQSANGPNKALRNGIKLRSEVPTRCRIQIKVTLPGIQHRTDESSPNGKRSGGNTLREDKAGCTQHLRRCGKTAKRIGHPSPQAPECRPPPDAGEEVQGKAGEQFRAKRCVNRHEKGRLGSKLPRTMCGKIHTTKGGEEARTKKNAACRGSGLITSSPSNS